MAHVKDIAITEGKIYRGGCHCRDCFQIAGLSRGSTSVPDDSFELTAQQTLGWYDSSA